MTNISAEVCDCGCGEPVDADLEQEAADDSTWCTATFREPPMVWTVYCQESGQHQRHTSGEGGAYYAWLDGDEGAGWDR